MPAKADDSSRAFQELIRVLENAVRAGVRSIGLEYKGRDLMVFYQAGAVGLAVGSIPQELQQDLIDELAKRSRLSRTSGGKLKVRVLGKEHEVVVDTYDSFGESAYHLMLHEPKKQARR